MRTAGHKDPTEYSLVADNQVGALNTSSHVYLAPLMSVRGPTFDQKVYPRFAIIGILQPPFHLSRDAKSNDRRLSPTQSGFSSSKNEIPARCLTL